MSADALSKSMLESACYEAGLDPQETLMNYSGRFMYGKDCLGLSVDSMSDAVKFIISIADVDRNLADKMADDLTTDSLGLGIVAYFPRITPPEDLDDYDEEAEDDDK